MKLTYHFTNSFISADCMAWWRGCPTMLWQWYECTPYHSCQRFSCVSILRLHTGYLISRLFQTRRRGEQGGASCQPHRQRVLKSSNNGESEQGGASRQPHRQRVLKSSNNGDSHSIDLYIYLEMFFKFWELILLGSSLLGSPFLVISLHYECLVKWSTIEACMHLCIL